MDIYTMLEDSVAVRRCCILSATYCDVLGIYPLFARQTNHTILGLTISLCEGTLNLCDF